MLFARRALKKQVITCLPRELEHPMPIMEEADEPSSGQRLLAGGLIAAVLLLRRLLKPS